MTRLLKLLLALLLLALMGGGCYALAWFRHWPWWVGLWLFLGVLGLVLLLWLGIYHLRRRRQRAFIRRVLAEDAAAVSTGPRQEAQNLQDLERDWAEAVEQLKLSQLRRRGDPIYALPWYLVLGISGAGKTSAIQHSGLDPMAGEQHRQLVPESTRNCDWWLFDQAVILDTAGRYAIHQDEALDHAEWERFLTLLAKVRRREPVNGVVVVVPADQLQAADPGALHQDALDLRRRIDNLTRTLGARAPVYVLVTKLDRVQGLAAFAAAVPDRLQQAMGYTNDSQDPHWHEVLEQAMASVSGRLRELRLALVRRQPEAGPGLLLFPREFDRLKPGLERFLQPLFQPNPYLETPILRGLFFSSAARIGGARSEFLATFRLPDPAGPVPAQGLFLREFFSGVLPRDRHLHRPIREFLGWRRLRRNVGLLGWTCLWLGALGLAGAAFTLNLKQTRQVDWR